MGHSQFSEFHGLTCNKGAFGYVERKGHASIGQLKPILATTGYVMSYRCSSPAVLGNSWCTYSARYVRYSDVAMNVFGMLVLALQALVRMMEALRRFAQTHTLHNDTFRPLGQLIGFQIASLQSRHANGALDE